MLNQHSEGKTEITLTSTFLDSSNENVFKKRLVCETENTYYSIEKLLDFLNENGLQISKSKIYKLTSSKKIPFLKFNSKLVFEKQKLITWIETQKKDPFSKNLESIAFLSNSASFKLNTKIKK